MIYWLTLVSDTHWCNAAMQLRLSEKMRPARTGSSQSSWLNWTNERPTLCHCNTSQCIEDKISGVKDNMVTLEDIVSS